LLATENAAERHPDCGTGIACSAPSWTPVVSRRFLRTVRARGDPSLVRDQSAGNTGVTTSATAGGILPGPRRTWESIVGSTLMFPPSMTLLTPRTPMNFNLNILDQAIAHEAGLDLTDPVGTLVIDEAPPFQDAEELLATFAKIAPPTGARAPKRVEKEEEKVDEDAADDEDEDDDDEEEDEDDDADEEEEDLDEDEEDEDDEDDDDWDEDDDDDLDDDEDEDDEDEDDDDLDDDEDDLDDDEDEDEDEEWEPGDEV